jgi:hypothetical protein
LLSTLLTAATALLTTLFFALTLLAFTFLSLAILLLAALLPGVRFAWFVWILLSFHIAFRCYITHFSLISD